MPIPECRDPVREEPLLFHLSSDLDGHAVKNSLDEAQPDRLLPKWRWSGAPRFADMCASTLRFVSTSTRFVLLKAMGFGRRNSRQQQCCRHRIPLAHPKSV
jgi:hypothetical protein